MGKDEVFVMDRQTYKYLNKMITMATIFIASCPKVNELQLSPGYTFYTTLSGNLSKSLVCANKV